MDSSSLKDFWRHAVGLGLIAALPAALSVAGLAQPSDPGAPAPRFSAAAETGAHPPQVRIDYFRELLMMSPAQLDQALTSLPDEKSRALREKIREYKMLNEQERESRLRLVEVWAFLVPLMKLPPGNRGTMLAMTPATDRQLIEERLAQWDLLPVNFKTEVLENKQTILYFLRFETSTPSEKEELLSSLSEPSRKALEQQLEQWKSRPLEERQRMCQHFQLFFELAPKEKEKTLEALSEDERLKMEAALEHYGKLPPEQRQMCIDSFEKLANMSREERAQFLRKAERWAAMTPRERQTWRNLVTLLPAPKPPLPDAFNSTLPPKGTNYPPSARPTLPGQF